MRLAQSSQQPGAAAAAATSDDVVGDQGDDSNDQPMFSPPNRWRAVRTSTVVWVVALNVLVGAAFTILSDDGIFLRVANLQNMALNASTLTLLACGTAMLLGSGHFDVSLGANLILSSVVGARILAAITGSSSPDYSGVPEHLAVAIPLAICGAVLTGATVGLLNGVVVECLKVNAFIATLGMMGIASGAAYLIAGGTNVGNLPRALQQNFGIDTAWGIPKPVLVVAIAVVVLWFTLAKTRFGSRTLAIGSSRSAAVRAGLPVRRHLISLFALAGLLAGIAGFLDLVRFRTTNIGGHQTDALAAISAAVIGGAGLQGGRASIIGAVAGVALAEMMQTGLVIVGLSPFYQLIAVGLVLIVAVALDAYRRQRI